MTDKHSEVTWESPPPIGQGRYDWQVIAAKLEMQPGEWAKVFDKDKTSIVNAIRQGKIAVLRPELGFEIRTANNIRKPRTCSLYLRYNPPVPKAPVKRSKKKGT